MTESRHGVSRVWNQDDDRNPHEPQRSQRTNGLSANDIFPLLADTRRRYVLHYLSGRVGAVSLGELAEQIVLWEGTRSRDHYERVLTSLYHNHLPRLVDGGLIRYDVSRETVVGTAAMDAVDAYLDLAIEADLRETPGPT